MPALISANALQKGEEGADGETQTGKTQTGKTQMEEAQMEEAQMEEAQMEEAQMEEAQMEDPLTRKGQGKGRDAHLSLLDQSDCL
ncbi:hypothetical protein F2P79_024792 [Pimephales promelas]|nr:hypothetical protein F2P79_024792 [Pimephales promelas]